MVVVQGKESYCTLSVCVLWSINYDQFSIIKLLPLFEHIIIKQASLCIDEM